MAGLGAAGGTRFKFDPANGSTDLLSSFSPAALQETPPIPESTSGWRFIAQSHWWIPVRIRGPVEIGGTSTDVDIDLGTILDDLKFIVEGGFELGYDKWSFEVWSIYANIGTDATTTAPPFGTRTTGVDFKLTIVDMVGAYHVGDWPLGISETETWGLDLLAGLIVYDLDLEVETLGPFGMDLGLALDESWVDGVIGGRLVFEFSDKLSASLRGEVGGFGIGSSSDLVWNITLLGEYRLSPKVGLVAGFRYFNVDWEKGSGSDRVGYDWEIYGPIMGVNIYF